MSGTILYVTMESPLGTGEVWVSHEMRALVRQGADLLVAPREGTRRPYHGDLDVLLPRVIGLPIVNGRIVRSAVRSAARRPAALAPLVSGLARLTSGGRPFAKGLVVLPKALALADLLAGRGVVHVHAHSTTTLAVIAWALAERLGVPWSFTLHASTIVRPEYAASLAAMTRSAAFARCISEEVRAQLVTVLDAADADKALVVRMGVPLPPAVSPIAAGGGRPFTVVLPGALVPRKGHDCLVAALARLRAAAPVDVHCLLCGDGPLRTRLAAQTRALGLEDVVTFCGAVPNDALLTRYARGEVDAVVLPATRTPDGNYEGIPVALMEAMAAGVPVISTATGGIPELLGDGGGIMLPEADPAALAAALGRLMAEPALRRDLGERGRATIAREFDADANARALVGLFANVPVGAGAA